MWPEWKPIETAPKSMSKPVGPFHDPISGKMMMGADVRGIYLLGFCPDEGLSPQACITVIWWEPHQGPKGEGEWISDTGSVRPTHWMELPAAPA